MSATERKLQINDFRAIKCVGFLVVALFLGFFVVGEVLAMSDSFEIYPLGNINNPCQNNWYGMNFTCPYEYGFIVNTEHASEGLKSVVSHPTSTDLVGTSELWWATSTTAGIFSIDFWVDKKPNWAQISLAKEFCCSFEIEIGDYTTKSTKIKLGNIILAENYANNVWHRISIEYNLTQHWARTSFDFGSWSATTTISSEITYINRYLLRSGGEDLEQIYFDNMTDVGECNSTCIYCSFNECINYETFCFWNETENQCQVLELGLPELPELEECSGLGVTDRLLCEIKNFFYRLFVPSGDKVTELRNTIDLIKTKFPYNYVLAMKDFFAYLKDNINEEQAINFSILGQAGTINLAFWNATSTIAGSTQSFLDIFKIFFKFILIVGFGWWCFSFLKRIFK